MAIQTLTGNTFQVGSAIDDSQTDSFLVFGPNNTILENAGTCSCKAAACPRSGRIPAQRSFSDQPAP